VNRSRAFLAGVAAVGTAATTLAAAPGATAHQLRRAHGPKNVIVMISDGWGYNHVAATDHYQYGRTGTQIYEHFGLRTAMSTYSVEGSYSSRAAWSSFARTASGATDSAAASTAMSTGVKTLDGAIGKDQRGKDLVHAFQVAEKAGRSTGVVTSVQFSHATPAGFVAHNTTRNDYSGIAREMIYDSAADVIMGAGSPCHDADGQSNGCTGSTKYVGGNSTWADLTDADGALGADANGDGRKDPWTLIQSRRAFQQMARGSTPRRVVGVAQVDKTLQQGRICTATATNPFTGVTGCSEPPYKTNDNASVPTLSEMSAAALNVLDQDRDGFGLMVEGGAVDWAAHANSLGRLIEEQAAFNRAVRTVVQWIGGHGGWKDNLLIVTGDHECGYLTGPGSDPTWTTVVGKGRGRLPLAEFHSSGHTNSLIPFYAQGAGTERLFAAADQYDSVRGRYLDNAELGKALKRLLAG
jgi:alkaline phosphatase